MQPHLPEAGGGGLSLDDVDSLSTLTPSERAWLREVYKLNKELHVLGIGSASEPSRLFAARARAAASIVSAREHAPQEPVHPGLAVLGHVLAAAFAVAGMYLFALTIGLVLHPTADSEGRTPTQAQQETLPRSQAPVVASPPPSLRAGTASTAVSESAVDSSITEDTLPRKPATQPSTK